MKPAKSGFSGFDQPISANELFGIALLWGALALMQHRPVPATVATQPAGA